MAAWHRVRAAAARWASLRLMSTRRRTNAASLVPEGELTSYNLQIITYNSGQCINAVSLVPAGALWLDVTTDASRTLALLLLALAMTGFLIGRRGSALRLLDDLHLVMIGPAYLMSRLFVRLGIPH